MATTDSKNITRSKASERKLRSLLRQGKVLSHAHVFTNLMICSDDGRRVQIDALVINPDAIYIVEVKTTLADRVSGSEDMETWVKIRKNRGNRRNIVSNFRNPLMQTKRAEEVLRDFLPKGVVIKHLVVFDGGVTLKVRLLPNSTNAVKPMSKVVPFLLKDRPVIYNKEERDKLADLICRYQVKDNRKLTNADLMYIFNVKVHQKPLLSKLEML